jgi:hypothetical protein
LGLSCTIELFSTLRIARKHLQKKKKKPKTKNQDILGAKNNLKALAKKKTKRKNQKPKIKLFSVLIVTWRYL